MPEHWYTKNGEAAHTQPTLSKTAKNPNRSTTIKDARKLGLLPSVTSILKLESEAEQAAAEIKRIQALKKAKENTVARLRDTLLAALMVFTEEDSKGISRYETPLAKLSTRKSQSVEILDDTVIPDEFWVIKKEVSKSTISQSIKDGLQVPGAQLKENISLSLR